MLSNCKYRRIYFQTSFTFSRINGELWNEIEVLKYIKIVYHPDNISSIDQIKMVLDELQEKIGYHDASSFDEAHKKINSFCRKR